MDLLGRIEAGGRKNFITLFALKKASQNPSKVALRTLKDHLLLAEMSKLRIRKIRKHQAQMLDIALRDCKVMLFQNMLQLY